MITVHDLKRLKAQGWRIAKTEIGPRASGKTTRARAFAAELQKEGSETMVDDMPDGTHLVLVRKPTEGPQL
jgi:hypothetical protein